MAMVRSGFGGVDGGYFGAGAPQVCFQVVQPRHSGYTSYRAVAWGWSVQSVGILHVLAVWLFARKSALAGGVIFLLPTPGLKCFLVPRAYRNAV